ncbi:MAG: mandelate racemase/muconate lactonizing enzyme family protein [Thalassospira sp.]|uniref:mandelate racemase/muconate lactonizing enzyme family protein n=1 Tax=Thalassospira sp. TaxID=1912094 RepID=UPI003A851923
MKITKIAAYEVTMGLKLGPYVSAKGTLDTLVSTIVAVHTDEGLTGWGEVCPWGAAYLPALHGAILPILAELAPALIGRDPRMLSEVNQAMDSAVMHQFYVKSAIDYACWDILGKVAGLPVYALLGGKLTEHLPMIASIPGGVDAMRSTVKHYKSQGYRQFSIHISQPVREEFQAYRDVIVSFDKDAVVLIDANQSWSMRTAIEVAEAFKGLTVMLEQPVADIQQCALLRRKIDLPVGLDESIVTPEDIIHAGAAGILEYIGLKMGRCGGLTRTKRICDAADSLGIGYFIKDVIGSEIATLATAHMAHSRLSKNMIGTLNCVDMVDVVTGTANLTHGNGEMYVPDMTPGLGFEPDMTVLGKPVAQFS